MNENKQACPVDRTINLFSKKWEIQIIRDMFFGKKHFKEFKEDKPTLSNKVLSNCLKELEENNLIEKRVIDTKPVSTEYVLTEYGESLNKVIYELAMFTLEHDDNNYDENTTNHLKETFRKRLNIEK